MEKFLIQKDLLRKVRRFNLQGRTTEFKILPVPENVEPVGWVNDALEQIIKKATNHLQPNDMVGIGFCSKEFRGGPGWLSFRDAGDIKTEDLWKIIYGVFQSNSTGFNTDTFCLEVTSVRMPAGRGRGKNYNSFGEECRRRRGIIVIENKDNLCLPRALVVGVAHANKDPMFRAVRQDVRKEQTLRAEELLKNASVTVPEEGAGIKELEQFQKYLKDFKITVYEYGKGRDVIFAGEEAENKINLLYHKGHFNVIISLTAAFCCSYYCETCHVPYEQIGKHKCNKKCFACLHSPQCQLIKYVQCFDCGRKFRSDDCFNNHKKPFFNKSSVCNYLHRCRWCYKTITMNREHYCGEIFCKICNKHQPQNHLCYMRPDTGKPVTKNFLFVFYDLESTQETVLEDGSVLHEPNLCVYKTCCEECISSDGNKCPKCGDRTRVSTNQKHNLLNRTPVEWFMTTLLALRQLYKNVVVVAHNGKAYDHQFLLNYVLTKTDLVPNLLMRGTKIISMTLGNVKFIDSINFFPMALSKLPSAFGLPDKFKKGYFPHLFNKLENFNYVGSLPPVEYYSPNTMTATNDLDEEGERGLFLKWYEEHKKETFDFKKEIVEYCTSDVEILTEACVKFRQQMMEICNVCPLTEACTIASACNKIFRRNYLNLNTIGIIPKGGYRQKDNHSKIATQWLVWEEKQRGIEIIHAGKDREYIINGLKVDGYCKDTNQVFEFHGCYFHGHPSCLKHNRDQPLHDNPAETLNLRYESTINKIERLKQLGYEVIEMWECSFRSVLSSNKSIQSYLENHPLVSLSPLNPRDSFYGGRTGNCKTFYKAEPGEKIKYFDVCSLYPWVCKYGKYPIGHPQIFVGEESCSQLNLTETDGLIKCKILPPQDLYHPVLPLKLNDKLMFVLCRTCGELMNQGVCSHDEEERSLTGTWVIDEVVKALEMGYRILDRYEIWKYRTEKYNAKTKTGGLFAGIMNNFIKIKQEASGWPSCCVTEEEKAKYIEDFLNKEGIGLDPVKIVCNPGLRSMAKLNLNSFWGKFGQRENLPKTVIINNPEEFFTLISNPSLNVNSVVPINDEVVVVNYEHRDEVYDPLSTVNVCLAAFTTAQARLKLYSYLETLGDRVLYYDTDSVIYVSREGQPEIFTGNCIGDMTDELAVYGTESYITQFASGGPKNYAYEIFSTKMNKLKSVVKVKGIRINYETSKLITFDVIKDMIINRECPPVKIISHQIRSRNDHRVVTKQEIKHYRTNSTKRKFIGFDSVPYGFKRVKESPGELTS